MNIGSIPVFNVAREKMNFLNARQAVLAQNVANVDTPGFVGRDLKRPDFKKMASGAAPAMGLVRTDVQHLPTMSGVKGTSYGMDDVIQDEKNPDGSQVQLDDQLKRVAQTQMEYNVAINVYRKQISLFRMALGGNSGA